MGRPTGPYRTPAPVGTTAELGLVPDLIARIPCELWDPGRGMGLARPSWGGSHWPQRHLGPICVPTQGPAGHSSPLLPPPVSSLSPASSVSSAVAAADTAGRSPGTRWPWAWAVPAAAPPPTW